MVKIGSGPLCNQRVGEYTWEFNTAINLLGGQDGADFQMASKEFSRDLYNPNGDCWCDAAANASLLLKPINKELDSKNKEIDRLTEQWNKCQEGKKVLYREPISSEVEGHKANFDVDASTDLFMT